MNCQFSKMQKARRDKRISYRPSSGSYSLGAGYSGASRLEKTGLRAVLLEKEFKDDDGDVEYLYDQQDGAWGGPSRHVTIREEGDPEKSLQDLDSVRLTQFEEYITDDSLIAASIYSLDLPTIMSDQNEFALYPRFGKLNCLNLLHLQQHLFDLEQQLEDLNLEELTSMEAEDFMDNTRDVLEEPGATGLEVLDTEGQALKRKLIGSRKVALKNWLERADDPLARNSDSLRFLDEGSADVIALCARDSDILENFFQSRLLRILENWSIWAFVFPSIREAVATIRPTIQSRATLEFLRFLISLGGAVMIVAPVVVLYFTRSEWGRLMIIYSDKKEVLMATTGYTAVLVVFVGSDAFSDETVPMPG
ncbi:hypothetical protein DFP73DRAFT_588900 [Morchella snyderi]|nr:hypothetical protein DFP73DRAFT_588900 [Morchella snyderi]